MLDTEDVSHYMVYRTKNFNGQPVEQVIFYFKSGSTAKWEVTDDVKILLEKFRRNERKEITEIDG